MEFELEKKLLEDSCGIVVKVIAMVFDVELRYDVDVCIWKFDIRAWVC